MIKLEGTDRNNNKQNNDRYVENRSGVEFTDEGLRRAAIVLGHLGGTPVRPALYAQLTTHLFEGRQGYANALGGRILRKSKERLQHVIAKTDGISSPRRSCALSFACLAPWKEGHAR